MFTLTKYFSLEIAKRVNIASGHQNVDFLLRKKLGRRYNFYHMQNSHKHLHRISIVVQSQTVTYLSSKLFKSIMSLTG